MLQAIAGQLGPEVLIELLRRPFVHYVSNSVPIFGGHPKALAAVGRGIRGCLLLEGPSTDTSDNSGLNGVTTVRWRKWTITDYVLTQGALEAYAVRDGRSEAVGPLLASDHADTRLKTMREANDAIEPLLERRPDGLRRPDDGRIDLDSVFQLYRRSLLGAEDSIPPPTRGI